MTRLLLLALAGAVVVLLVWLRLATDATHPDGRLSPEPPTPLL